MQSKPPCPVSVSLRREEVKITLHQPRHPDDVAADSARKPRCPGPAKRHYSVLDWQAIRRLRDRVKDVLLVASISVPPRECCVFEFQYRRGEAPDNIESIRRHWHALQNWFKRKGASGVWVVEFEKGGHPHITVLCDTAFDATALKKHWRFGAATIQDEPVDSFGSRLGKRLKGQKYPDWFVGMRGWGFFGSGAKTPELTINLPSAQAAAELRRLLTQEELDRTGEPWDPRPGHRVAGRSFRGTEAMDLAVKLIPDLLSAHLTPEQAELLRAEKARRTGEAYIDQWGPQDEEAAPEYQPSAENTQTDVQSDEAYEFGETAVCHPSPEVAALEQMQERDAVQLSAEQDGRAEKVYAAVVKDTPTVLHPVDYAADRANTLARNAADKPVDHAAEDTVRSLGVRKRVTPMPNVA